MTHCSLKTDNPNPFKSHFKVIRIKRSNEQKREEKRIERLRVLIDEMQTGYCFGRLKPKQKVNRN